MALEGARGVKGDFTPLPSPVRKGDQAGNVQKAPAASLGCPCICQRLGAGKEGWDGAWACTGLEEMSWAKVLATGPRQQAGLMCWEFPQTLGKFGMSWEVVIFQPRLGVSCFQAERCLLDGLWEPRALASWHPALRQAVLEGEWSRQWRQDCRPPSHACCCRCCCTQSPLFMLYPLGRGAQDFSLQGCRAGRHFSPWLNTL